MLSESIIITENIFAKGVYDVVTSDVTNDFIQMGMPKAKGDDAHVIMMITGV